MKTLLISVFAVLFSFSAAFSQDLGKTDKAVKKHLNKVLSAYFDLKNELVASDAAGAKQNAESLSKLLSATPSAKMKGNQLKVYTDLSAKINSSLQLISASEDVEKQRVAFEPLSENIRLLITAFKANSSSVYVQFCPMAFNDKGASWLSERSEVRNPYFGKMMLTCGSVKSEF